MWKFKYAWPVYVTFVLFGLRWGVEWLEVNGTINARAAFDFHKIWIDVIPILYSAIGIYFLSLNRFKGDLFWSFTILFVLYGVYEIVEELISNSSQLSVIIVIGVGVIFNILYLMRHFGKPSQTKLEWVKLAAILITFCLFPILISMNFLSTLNPFREFVSTPERVFYAFWNLLFFAVLLLNLHDLHRRDQQQQQADYEQLVEEVGTE